MQNQTQNPQSFYTKPNSAGNVPTTQPVTPQPVEQNNSKKPANKSLKNVFAVVGLVLFLVIAMMGVLIAQRQVAQKGEDIRPVAPNAPESKPEAALNVDSCNVSFTVKEAGVNCNEKIALTDFTENEGTPIAAGSEFNVGDEFVFRITIQQPTDGVAYNVVVQDVLPDSLEFVEEPTDPSYGITNNGQTVTATIPEMGSSSAVRVEFKVRVTDESYGQTTNTATVSSGSGEGASCSYDYSILKGTVECIDKKMYNSDGDLVVAGSALTRGEKYEYKVNIEATNRINDTVVITDVIPEPLEFDAISAESKDFATYDSDTNTVTANFEDLEDEPQTLSFTVLVPDEPGLELGDVVNNAEISLLNEEVSEVVDSCDISHKIVPVGTATCVEKEAYHDFDGSKIIAGSDIDPGQEFIYRITVTAEETTTGPVVLVDNLPEDLLFITNNQNTEGLNYDSTTREVSIDLDVLESGEEKIVEFKVQLISDPDETSFKNVATITTNEDDDNAHTCEISLDITQPEPEYECNSPCDSDSNCSEIGDAAHICYSSTNTCRLESNPDDEDCEPQETVPPTTPPATNPPATNPPATPAPGCNDLCEINADCSNIDHICVTVATGENRCRLAEYIDSVTCTQPQPELPTVLPETGPADWLNWLKAGLVTMGVGTALFLLL